MSSIRTPFYCANQLYSCSSVLEPRTYLVTAQAALRSGAVCTTRLIKREDEQIVATVGKRHTRFVSD